MKLLLGLLSLLFKVVLPVLFQMREKSREAIEIVPDPELDAELDSYEWVS